MIVPRGQSCINGKRVCHYFNRLPWIWNKLSLIHMTLPIPAIKTRLYKFLWNHFLTNDKPYILFNVYSCIQLAMPLQLIHAQTLDTLYRYCLQCNPSIVDGQFNTDDLWIALIICVTYLGSQLYVFILHCNLVLDKQLQGNQLNPKNLFDFKTVKSDFKSRNRNNL